MPHLRERFQEENCDLEFGFGIVGQGRATRGRSRGRTRNTKSQRSIAGTRSETSRRKSTIRTDQVGEPIGRKGRTRSRGGRRCGQPSVRNRKKPAKVLEAVGEKDTLKEVSYENTPGGLVSEEWSKDETRSLQPEAGKASSSERLEYDDGSARASADDYDTGADYYGSGFKGNAGDSQEGSDASVYSEGDDDNDEVDEDIDDAAEDREDMDVEGYTNADSEEDDGIAGDEVRNSYMDDGAEFASSDYSDLGD